MKIVIPTLERYDTLKNTTLKYLDDCGIEKDMIDIFVASEEEKEKYIEKCGDYNYIIGLKGKANISNFIVDYYNENDRIFCIDDDIDGIFYCSINDNIVKKQKVLELENFINDCFETSDKMGAKIFSVHGKSNDYWLATSKRSIKKSIVMVGGAFGMRIDKQCRIETYIDDWERSIFYWKKYNGNNIIFCKYTLETAKQWNEGGLFEERTIENYENEFNKLCWKYPEMEMSFSKGSKNTPFKPKIKRIVNRNNYDINFDEDLYNYRFKYRIAIPSYKRPNKLCKMTLDLLQRNNIPLDCVTIFVHTLEEKFIYQDAVNNNYPNCGIKIHITNQVGIGQTRTYIRRYYNDNSKVVFLDDDIEEILEKDKDKCKDINKLFCVGFNECKKEKATIWGIPIFDNHFYMKDTITTSLKYIAGGVCGVILTKDVKEFNVNIDQWEDYLFSLKHFHLDGKVIRMNKYGVKTKCYSADGGISSAMGSKKNRIDSLDKSAKELCCQYPTAMKVYYKKNGIPNIRLNYRYSKSK